MAFANTICPGRHIDRKESVMKSTDIHKALMKAAKMHEGRQIVSCKSLLQLAGKFSVPPIKLGRICDKEGIKIRHCKLGCF